MTDKLIAEDDYKKVQKMNPEIKSKWLDALRSGEYGQTEGKLNDNHGGFCCLGVLCDLYTKEHENSGWKDFSESTRTFFEDLTGQDSSRNSNNSYPTPGVIEWSGIGGQNPYTNTNRFDDVEEKSNYKAALSVLNDFKRYDFNQIADVIERDF